MQVQWLFGHPAWFVTHQKSYTSAKKTQKWMAVIFLANTLYYIKWKDNTLNQLEAILHNRRIFQILKLFWASRDFDDSIKYTFKKWISFWIGRCGKQIILNFKKEPSRQARLFMLHQSIPYCLGPCLQALDLLKWAGIKTLINAQVRRKDLPSPAETNCYKVIQMRRVSTYSNYHSWRKQVSNQDDITLHMNMLP